MSPYEFAAKMYHREHDRWNQWALFFLGSIAGIFTIWSTLRGSVSLCWPSLMAAILSVLWVLVALTIRGSTRAWERTLKRIEFSPYASRIKPMIMFRRYFDRSSRWRDFVRIVLFYKCRTFRSVTALLVWVGVLSFLIFLGLFLVGLSSPTRTHLIILHVVLRAYSI